MGLGSTAKKLQKVADMAEDLVGRLNELRERVIRMEETVDETSDEVASLEQELAEHRAILEAMAAGEGVDVDEVVAEVEAGQTEDASRVQSNQQPADADRSAATESDENA